MLSNYLYHALDDLSKNNVTSVQPRCYLSSDEKLRSISVLASISHGQPSSTIVLQLKVFIFKTFTINRAT